VDKQVSATTFSEGKLKNQRISCRYGVAYQGQVRERISLLKNINFIFRGKQRAVKDFPLPPAMDNEPPHPTKRGVR